MDIVLLAMLGAQIVITILGAYCVRPTERLTVIGMVSVWSGGIWLIVMLGRGYCAGDEVTYSPVIALMLSLISHGGFWIAYRLDEEHKKLRYGTNPASK